MPFWEFCAKEFLTFLPSNGGVVGVAEPLRTLTVTTTDAKYRAPFHNQHDLSQPLLALRKRFWRDEDYAKTREWYQKAADKGNARAMAYLGLVYQNGRGAARGLR